MDKDLTISEDSYSTLPPSLFKFYQPQFTTYFAAICFFIFGIVLTTVGSVLYVLQPPKNIFFYDYTNCIADGSNVKCKDIIKNHSNVDSTCYCTLKIKSLHNNHVTKNPHVYYMLENFYQNVREYADSYDSKQLKGDLRSNRTLCIKSTQKRRNIFPCGLIARSLFNDTFLFYIDSHKINLLKMPYYHENRFVNPDIGLNKQTLAAFDKPDFWPKPIYELDTNDPTNNGLRNYNFIIWMTTYPFPNALKYLGKWPQPYFNTTKNEITIVISFNYNVNDFNGKKFIIIAPQNPLGFRNMFLPFLYFISGSVTLILSLLFFIYTKITGSKSNDSNSHIHFFKATPNGSNGTSYNYSQNFP